MTERKRSYQPGYRKKEHQGRLSNGRWAWLDFTFGRFMIWVTHFPDDEGEPTDEISDIKLMHPIPGRKLPVSWNLTALTQEELLAFKDIVNSAIEWALPIVVQRDKEAQDAFDNGDDTHARIYRQVPQLVYRQRPEPQHGEGVHDGPSDASPVLGEDGDQL